MNATGSKRIRLKALWSTSFGLSMVVLATYPALGSREPLLVLVPLGAVHLYVCARSVDTITLEFLASQSVIALSTITAVVLYSAHSVGGYPEGGWSMVKSFAISSISEASSYSYLGIYSLVLGLVVGCFMWAMLKAGLRRQVTSVSFFVLAFATNAVGMPISYCLFQPLHHVGGELDALAFFFAAGVFGLDLSVALYCLLAVPGLLTLIFVRDVE